MVHLKGLILLEDLQMHIKPETKSTVLNAVWNN